MKNDTEKKGRVETQKFGYNRKSSLAHGLQSSDSLFVVIKMRGKGLETYNKLWPSRVVVVVEKRNCQA
jgi:hypothetical protein